jgi:hypothetical protein
MSTIPPTLTGRLPANGQLDAAAGLVYAGEGRWYDAGLGLYLQPDPFGGAPEAPASLNRYAAAQISTLPTLGSVPGGGSNAGAVLESLTTNAAKAVAGWAIGEGATPYLRALHRRGWQLTRLAGEVGHFRFRIPDEAMEGAIGFWTERLSGRTFRQILHTGGHASYHSLDTGAADVGVQYLLHRLRLAGLGEAAEFVSTRQTLRYLAESSPVGRAAGWLAWTRTGQRALDLGVGLGIDVGLQAALDWGMLQRGELTGWQYGERLAWAGAGSALSWVAVAVIGGGPWGIGAGIVVAVGYDLLLQPIIYRLRGLNPGDR